ncbi:outer membrane protein [Chelatococcus reniformis]|uniref:Outer membrane protein beta-barrel domain-containing protein n=1 Tax=Chelatococcus reniformis TaxID=1494448 RepID=A0A916UA20_9HYPH|nr:outer membrane beta-barrel protein [Chelatococcus reniformis]GGC64591.1 hypothetical protein GCM10010994_23990 [Chelatococcus reniformis]
MAVTAIAALPALAAELPPLPDLEPSTPIAVGGGWYLRGDAGVGSTSTSRARTPTVALVPVDTALVRQRIESGWSIGGGIGYRFGANFRTDLTVGGLVNQNFRAVGIDAANVGNPNSPAAYYRAGLSSTVALVNAYWDIATWEGITPFVGAGVGVAYNRLGGISRLDVGAPLGPAAGYDAIARGGRTQAAFALYAGLAYEIMPGLTAEVAYRYLNVGSAGSNSAICGTGYLCAAATPLRVKSIDSQEVTIGVRWSLNGA